MEYSIEVAVTEALSTTDQGKILEDLGEEVLKILQYRVTKEVRLTGMEVDLYAEHQVTGENIYVECKATRGALPADVITKLLGNISFSGVSSGWLLSTAPFSKDAKGLREQWVKKPEEERRRLHLYQPSDLVKLLIDSSRLRDPKTIQLPPDRSFSK